MIKPKYRFSFRFFKLIDYWSLGIICEQEQFTIGLIKWKFTITRLTDWSK